MKKYKPIKINIMSEFRHGAYYRLYNKKTNEETIAYFYHNPDDKCDGFGFNTADGGGFLPLFDLKRDDTIVEEVTLLINLT